MPFFSQRLRLKVPFSEVAPCPFEILARTLQDITTLFLNIIYLGQIKQTENSVLYLHTCQQFNYNNNILYFFCIDLRFSSSARGHRGRDHMVVGFITTYVFNAYHHLTLWVRTLLRPGVLDTILCDKVCQWLATGQWFPPGTPVSSINKTRHHDITEIVLKVVLNTMTLTLFLNNIDPSE